MSVDTVYMKCYLDVDNAHIWKQACRKRKEIMLKQLWRTNPPLTFTGHLLMLPTLAASQ